MHHFIFFSHCLIYQQYVNIVFNIVYLSIVYLWRQSSSKIDWYSFFNEVLC